jgi:hypothetical protein
MLSEQLQFDISSLSPQNGYKIHRSRPFSDRFSPNHLQLWTLVFATDHFPHNLHLSTLPSSQHQPFANMSGPTKTGENKSGDDAFEFIANAINQVETLDESEGYKSSD